MDERELLCSSFKSSSKNQKKGTNVREKVLVSRFTLAVPLIYVLEILPWAFVLILSPYLRTAGNMKYHRNPDPV